MSYIHCHNCGWDNDDFIESYGGYLGFTDNFIVGDLKNMLKPNYADHVKHKRFTAFKHLLHDINHLYKLTFKQKYKSYEQFKKENPEYICPICGKPELDID